jgi:oligopeptide transport system ATP-binding protein
MERVLDVKNLRVSYHTYAGEVQSVRGVDFHLDKGETLAIVGESGCGKTVTAKSIMRLIQTPPGEIKKGSEIFVDGKDVLAMKKDELRKLRGGDISMIFQDPMTSLNPTMKIGDQIAESLIMHKGMSKPEAFKEAVKMLNLVNIQDAAKRANQYPYEFSGGMNQRVMIAIALACGPKILIADEATTALDVTIQAQIIDLIKVLQGELGTAVIMITHDLRLVADIDGRIQVMYAGQIIERGLTKEVLYNPQHPYTWALLESVPGLEKEHKEKLYSIQGAPPDLIKPPRGCSFASRCSYCMTICLERMPEAAELTETHEVLCWLKHPLAPEVEATEGFGGKKK